MRWWDGTQWTTNLRDPEPAVVPTPPAVPEVSLSAYSPASGYAGVARDGNYSNTGGGYSGYANNGYSDRIYSSGPQVNNFGAWLGLIAGVVSIGVIIVRFSLPAGTYYLPFFGLTAIIASIRAIARYRRGTVTVLWAPIIGLVLGGIGEIILILSLVLAGTGTGVTLTPTKLLGPTGSATNYDVGYGSLKYLPTSNATLGQAATDESALVGMLQADYAPGKTGASANGSWPSQLTHDSLGNVTAADGRSFGQIITPGWHLAYKLESDGSYELAVTGPDTTEMAIYQSNTGEYSVVCETSDQTCATSSPLTPIVVNGSSTSGNSSTT